MNSWSDIYWHYRRKGMDPNDAAYRADQWEKRVEAAKRLDEEREKDAENVLGGDK